MPKGIVDRRLFSRKEVNPRARVSIFKNHKNWSNSSWDIDEKHIQKSWKSFQNFLRYWWKLYSKIMKIGPKLPQILMKNIFKNHENWSNSSWDIDEQHIQKSYKLVLWFLRYQGPTIFIVFIYESCARVLLLFIRKDVYLQCP